MKPEGPMPARCQFDAVIATMTSEAPGPACSCSGVQDTVERSSMSREAKMALANKYTEDLDLPMGWIPSPKASKGSTTPQWSMTWRSWFSPHYMSKHQKQRGSPVSKFLIDEEGIAMSCPSNMQGTRENAELEAPKANSQRQAQLSQPRHMSNVLLVGAFDILKRELAPQVQLGETLLSIDQFVDQVLAAKVLYSSTLRPKLCKFIKHHQSQLGQPEKPLPVRLEDLARRAAEVANHEVGQPPAEDLKYQTAATMVKKGIDIERLDQISEPRNKDNVLMLKGFETLRRDLQVECGCFFGSGHLTVDELLKTVHTAPGVNQVLRGFIRRNETNPGNIPEDVETLVYRVVELCNQTSFTWKAWRVTPWENRPREVEKETTFFKARPMPRYRKSEVNIGGQKKQSLFKKCSTVLQRVSQAARTSVK